MKTKLTLKLLLRNWKKNSGSKKKEVGNPDYNALTKTEGSMKKQMEQLGENLIKNLLNELQDSKRTMEEKLNHGIIQAKRYAESVQNTRQDRNQTPNGTFVPSWKKPRMQI